MRPRGKNSEASHSKRRDQNITKGRTSWEAPQKRVQAVVKARDEIQDSAMSGSLVGIRAPYAQRKLSLSDSFTYSFDRTESPNLPQSLEVYLKPTTERDTERFVQREYEILDVDGELVRGTMAKSVLRRRSSNMQLQGAAEDDGFELI
jgi:hypothetical protein